MTRILFAMLALTGALMCGASARAAGSDDALARIETRLQAAPMASDASFTAQDYGRLMVDIFFSERGVMTPSELATMKEFYTQAASENMTADEINKAAGWYDVLGADAIEITDAQFKTLKERLKEKGYGSDFQTKVDEIAAEKIRMMYEAKDAAMNKLYDVIGIHNNASFAIDTLQSHVSKACLHTMLEGALTQCNDRERLIAQIVNGDEASLNCDSVFLKRVASRYSAEDLVSLRGVSPSFVTEGTDPDPRSAELHAFYLAATESCNRFARNEIQSKLNSNPTTETE